MAPVENNTETAEVHSTTDDGAKPEEIAPANGKAQETTSVKVEIEEESEPPSQLEAAVIKQVEYYFSDLNLPRDNFLKEQLQLVSLKFLSMTFSSYC